MAETQSAGGDLRASQTSELSTFVFAAAAYCVAWAPSWMQPITLPEILHLSGGDRGAAAFVLTVEMASLSLASAFSPRFLTGRSLRDIAVVAVLASLAAHILSFLAPNYPALIALRGICGVAEGVAFMTAVSATAGFAQPERAYARLNIANVVSGLVLIYGAQFVGGLFGGQMAFASMALLCIIGLPLLFFGARSLQLKQAEAKQGEGRLTWVIILLLAGAACYSSFSSGIWPLMFIMGMRTGLTTSELTNATTIAMAVALGCSILVGVMGNRFGRVPPALFGLFCIGSSSLVLTNTLDPQTYSLAIIVYASALYFASPYFYGASAAEDPSGRTAAKIGGVFLMAQAIGPYIGGNISQNFGYAGVGAIAASACFIAALCFVTSRTLSTKGKA